MSGRRRAAIAGVRVGGLAPRAAARRRAGGVREAAAARRRRQHVRAPPGEARDRLRQARGRPRALGEARARTSTSWSRVHGAAVRSAVAALARRFDRKGRSATLDASSAASRAITPQIDGARSTRARSCSGSSHALTANMRRPLAVRTATIAARGHRAASFGAGDPDQPRAEPPDALPARQQRLAHVPGRDRPGDLPDARPAASRSSSSRSTRGGTRRRYDAWAAGLKPGAARARTTRSARAGWASRRPASASTAPTSRARSAATPRTAASACRSSTPSGCSTTSGSARRCSSSDAGSLMRRLLRSPSVVVVLALLGLLVWKVAHNPKGLASEVDKQKIVPAYPFTRPRVGAPGTSASPRCAARSSCSTSGSPTARRARTRRRSSRRSRSSGRARTSSSSGSTSRISPGPATKFMRRFDITYPMIADDGPLIGHYGVTGYPETFFIDRRGRVIPLPPNTTGRSGTSSAPRRRQLLDLGIRTRAASSDAARDEGVRRSPRDPRARLRPRDRRSARTASGTRRRPRWRPTRLHRPATSRSTSRTRRSRSR